MAREISGAEVNRWLQPDDDFSRTTNYSDYSIASRRSERSGQLNQKKLQTERSFSTRAQKVAAVFTTCFVPHRNRRGEVVDEEDDKNIVKDISVSSASNISTTSSGSKYKFSNGDNRSDMQQGISTLSMAKICKATSNFAEANIIGQGGFGTVYKGKLKDGTLIAVKRAKKNMHGKHLSSEFKNEIETLSKVEHLNLVKLLGYIEHDDERLIVVEYVSNGNLREHLDGRQSNVLDFDQRLNIAIDVAHAIAYMHTYTDRPIIHRDIKASNILLADNFRAKVADFGFACLVPDSDVTHISTQIKGTSGYLDPEYINTYQLTEKSDVYSFGVLLVELITGRRPLEQNRDLKERVTTRWAVHKYREGNVVMAMDARLRRTPASVMAAERVMGLAEECMAPSRRSRPAMRRCAEVLWDIRRGYREMLQAPPRRPTWPSPSSSTRTSGTGERINQT